MTTYTQINDQLIQLITTDELLSRLSELIKTHPEYAGHVVQHIRTAIDDALVMEEYTIRVTERVSEQ